MTYAAIADWAEQGEYSVTFMCAQLGVCRQGYYRWRANGPCQRERTDAELTEIIEKIHTELSGDPGVRRVRAESVVLGHRLSPTRVRRLMKAAGLPGTPPQGMEEDDHRRRAARRCAGSDRPGLPPPNNPTPAGAATSPPSRPSMDGSTPPP